MLLLVTDTSGRHGSVALARAVSSSGDVELIESAPLAGGTFSAQLVPQIIGLLEKHGLSKRDIDAFVVVSGPGSFTGLRVGLAAIKALAEILGRPIVAVSLLEVITMASAIRGNVLAVLDAGRGEIYAGEYEVGESARLVREQLLSKDEFVSLAAGTAVATPDAALEQLARSAASRFVQRVEMPSSERIARVGWQRLQAGQTVTPAQLDANYIRKSDAEIFAKSGRER